MIANPGSMAIFHFMFMFRNEVIGLSSVAGQPAEAPGRLSFSLAVQVRHDISAVRLFVDTTTYKDVRTRG